MCILEEWMMLVKTHHGSDYNLCMSYLLIAFSVLYLSSILLVISFGWYNTEPSLMMKGLSYKFSTLLGWPKYLIALVTFMWTTLCLSGMDYSLSRGSSWLKNVMYYCSLYIMTVVISHCLMQFICKQIKVLS